MNGIGPIASKIWGRCTWLDVVLVVVLAIALYTDVRSNKIYNWLTFPAILFGLAANAVLGGWGGFQLALAGFGLGVGLLIIPAAMGGVGPGDMKLLAAVGAFKGYVFVFVTWLVGSVLGAVIALAWMLWQGGGMTRIKLAITSILSGTFVAAKLENATKEQKFPFGYGVTIVVGALVSYVYGYGFGGR